MLLGTKDLVLLVFGFGFGIIASVLANILSGPIFQILIGYNAISILSLLAPERFKNEIFSGDWEQKWHVKSKNFPPVNLTKIEFRRFQNHLATFHVSKSFTGMPIKYFAHASIVDNRYVIGRWYDKVSGGYYGTFFLFISPTREKATGVWAGVSSEKGVKSGKWEWKKIIEHSTSASGDSARTAIAE